MVHPSPSISIIVPTLNEAENIEGIIGKILSGAGDLPLEIIVVDDASKDDTQPIVRRLATTLPVILLARDQPKDGLAGAVLAGARAARANIVVVIDADGSHPPEKIPALATPIINGEKDMVIGSRYVKGGSTPGWSRKRLMMSRAASACAWPLTDVHDALSGFFAVRRDLLAAIPSDAAGFKIALEVLVRGGDSLRVGEVPIIFRDRELGQSKMGSRVIFTYFRRLLALSGWRESQSTMGYGIAKTVVLWTVDLCVFLLWLRASHNFYLANVAGFTAGAVLNAGLKLAQLPKQTSKSPGIITRLVLVSILAFFFRTGILGTFAMIFRWRIYSILPAIVAGWSILFLGYALFIYPVRDQYGSGMRSRVAGIGAVAYALALRLSFLFLGSISSRNLSHPWQFVTHFGFITTSLQIARGLYALAFWVISVAAEFYLAKSFFGKTNGFRALLYFSFLPVFIFDDPAANIVSVIIFTLALWGWFATEKQNA